MIPDNRIPTHPGEMLLEEFLVPLNISQTSFAGQLGIPLQRVNEIVRGKRGVTANTAWRFARALDTSPQFWMNLQANYDLAVGRPRESDRTRPVTAGVTRHERNAASRKGR